MIFKPSKIYFVLILLAGLVFGPSAFAASQDLYAQPFINQISANSQVENGQTAIIAVIDEGIDFSHPDLAGTNSEVSKNFYIENGSTKPLGPHGTQLAGVIKAASLGNPKIKLMNLIACEKVEGCDLGAIIKAIYFAVDNKADVINLSFEVVGNQNYMEEFNNAIAYAYQKNVVVVVAAGNGDANFNGIDLALRPVSPVCNDNGQNQVLGVSSAGQNGKKSTWANFGPCVDIYAPGENLYTTLSPVWNRGLEYSYKNGTSYSAAIVSAAAALIKSKNPSLSAREVMDLIIKNADNGGVLNISAALNSTPPQGLTFENLSKVGLQKIKPALPKKKLPVSIKSTGIKKTPVGKFVVR